MRLFELCSSLGCCWGLETGEGRGGERRGDYGLLSMGDEKLAKVFILRESTKKIIKSTFSFPDHVKPFSVSLGIETDEQEEGKKEKGKRMNTFDTPASLRNKLLGGAGNTWGDIFLPAMPLNKCKSDIS